MARAAGRAVITCGAACFALVEIGIVTGAVTYAVWSAMRDQLARRADKPGERPVSDRSL